MMILQTSAQIEQELGRRLKRKRLELNLSQEKLAKRSGLARRTITAVENGAGGTLSTLIEMLRALDSLAILEDFLPEPGPSPMQMARLREDPVRKYASKPRRAPDPGDWKWGDEK